jgi:tRNA1Val (adenine37-N6)-methyltransferase
MAKSHGIFRFKQFQIDHSQSAMKVGTDGVLLGAWTRMEGCRNVLDIGTGTGLIALMAAQRTSDDVTIDAVEIDKTEALNAQNNVASSPWASRVSVVHSRIQDYYPDVHYDLIVTNPPFFEKSLTTPDHRRSESRHTYSLPFEDLITAARRLMSPRGRFCLILPVVEGTRFIELAASSLFLNRRWTFRARQNKPLERLLLEFGAEKTELQEDEIVLYGEADRWSEAYKNLTEDFYLHL